MKNSQDFNSKEVLQNLEVTIISIQSDVYIFLPKKPKYDGEKYQANFSTTYFINESDLSTDPLWLLSKRFGDLSDVFKKLVPEINDWIIFASDSDIRKAVESVAELSEVYLSDVFIEEADRDSNYSSWLHEQAMEMGYLLMPDGTEFKNTPEQLQKLEDEGFKLSDLEVDDMFECDYEKSYFVYCGDKFNEWRKKITEAYTPEPKTVKELVEENKNLFDGHIAKLEDMIEIIIMNISDEDDAGLVQYLWQNTF
jgi:hypothetical protein